MKSYWLDGGDEISIEELRAEGVDAETLALDNFQPALDLKAAASGYVTQDVVEITPGMPNLEAVLAKFDKEHLHTDDEVRFVLAGRGIFDIRSRGDRWMRVEVYPSDYIAVPANRHHRFFVMDDKHIRCVRLFKDTSGWTPLYRPAAEATV
ncbi:MAG: cupin domain-containing protein [Elusimicrobia bacterium]|nr:cupin domain-containing protein [Elusimicrobiota bacterium]